MPIRLFDLNVEEVLENWETHHAIREVIANALDERLISATAPIRIVKQGDAWHVRDFGRGLRIEHFTQNENPEKLRYPTGVIGKFGVGLKDALATFHRRGIDLVIVSRYGTYRLKPAPKSAFSSITTLHVEYNDSSQDIEGTDVILRGVSEADMDAAKALFLAFSEEKVIESTPYGEILARKVDGARVYINGVYANEEPNFLFSYNVTSLTEAMKRRLNRERINVGRGTYTERVTVILKRAASDAVQQALIEQTYLAKGDQRDELQWIEVSQHALNLLSARRPVAFVTEQQLQARPEMVDLMRRDGYEVVTIGETQQAKLQQQIASGG